MEGTAVRLIGLVVLKALLAYLSPFSNKIELFLIIKSVNLYFKNGNKCFNKICQKNSTHINTLSLDQWGRMGGLTPLMQTASRMYSTEGSGGTTSLNGRLEFQPAQLSSPELGTTKIHNC